MKKISKDRLKILLKCKLNFNYFLTNYIKIEEPGGIINFNPYQAQTDLINDILLHKYIVVLKSRQIGISTIIQAFCIYLITFFPNVTIGIISRDGPESTDFARKCRIMFESLPKWMRPEYLKRTEQTIELTNNSRIIASQVNLSNPQSVFRGKTLTFLVIDEAAYIRKIKEAFTGILPAVFRAHQVAAKKQIPHGIVVLSTPNGTEGIGEWFATLYFNAVSGNSIFKPVRIHYSQAPFADEKWLEGQRKLLLASGTQDDIEQELELKFISGKDSYFEKETYSELQNILSTAVEPKEKIPKVYFNSKGRKIGKGEWIFFEEPTDEKFYLIGVDVAPSYGTCNSAIIVTDSNIVQVAEFSGKFRVMDLEEEILFIVQKYPNCLLIVEANTYATELVERLEENPLTSDRMFYRIKRDKRGKIIDVQPGLLTDQNTRPKMLTELYWVITNNPKRIKSKSLAAEVMSIKKDLSSKRLTDRAMSLALISYVKKYHPEYIIEDTSKNKLSSEDIREMLSIFREQDKRSEILDVVLPAKYQNSEVGQADFENFMFRDIDIYRKEDLIQIKEIPLF